MNLIFKNIKNFFFPEYISGLKVCRLFSPNFGRSIRYIVIHGTGCISEEEAIGKLTNRIFNVSSHYFIGAKGDLYRLVDDKEVAWHAGVSFWKNDISLNYTSIGIEIFNETQGMASPYSDEQYDTLIVLLKHLVAKYNIDSNNILGHSDIAPGRKVDPGIFFDWPRLEKAVGKCRS